MNVKRLVMVSMTALFFANLPISFAQTYPKPVKVTYEISDKVFLENDCKKETYFNKYSLSLPKVLEFTVKDSFEGVETVNYKTKDNTLIFWISDNRIYDNELLSHYQIANLYEFDKKVLYNEIHLPQDRVPQNLSEIEDISAKNWHGFLKLSCNQTKGVCMYQYWISSLDDKKFTEVVFIVKNNSIARKIIENIMASFKFL